MPEHTQYALFQLYCDLRANPIKDRHWFEVHARRLKPHTYAGWIVSALYGPALHVNRFHGWGHLLMRITFA